MLSCFSLVQLFATPWTVARQALLSMGSSRQKYWSGLPCPPPEFQHTRRYIFDFVTLWTIVQQAPLSMEFSRQKYWSGLPCPPPGDLPDSGIKPVSPASSALPGGSLTLMPPGKHTFTATSRLVRWTSLAVHWLRLRFQCGGWRFKPWLGNQDPTYCKVPPPLQKKKKQQKNQCLIEWLGTVG